MDWALSFYGLIPERVYEITSMTTKLAKSYDTPLGRFTYIKSPTCIYSKDITIKVNTNKTSFMIASKEKALCDKILFTKKLNFRSTKSMLSYLEFDLRIDLETIKEFNLTIINDCIKCGYKILSLKILHKIIENLQKD